VALKSEGKFKLVKVNIDSVPQLANGLKVRSIPAVFLISKGNLIDSFVGIPEQKVLEEFINTAYAIDALGKDGEVAGAMLKRGEEYLEGGQLDLAEKVYNELMSHEKWRDEMMGEISIGLAYCCLFQRKERSRALELLQGLREKKGSNVEVNEFYQKKLDEIQAEI